MSESIELNGEPIELGEQIGVGATGVVHEGTLAGGRKVAVKLLHAEYCNSSEAVSRYAREVTALSKLTHPNSVRLYGHGELPDGRVYIVMELLIGEELGELLRREGPLAIDRILPLFPDVCDAVAEAHGIGLVHRDIKPENIFVVREGGQETLKLMDFGFVRFSTDTLASEHTALTTTGSVLGTPGFMSPEQARGEQADARSDVYALAVTLYEALTGKIPFEGAGALQIMMAQTTKPPISIDKRVKGLSFEPSLSAAIMGALEPNLSARTTSAAALSEKLRASMNAALAYDPSTRAPSTRPPAMPELEMRAQSTPPSGRSMIVPAIALFLVAVAIGAYFAFAR